MSEPTFKDLQPSAEWEMQMAQRLNAVIYPEQADGATMDTKAFNIGLLSVIKAMQRGELDAHIVETTNGAFEAMRQHWGALPVKPQLSTSYTGQMLCATIYALTQGSLKADRSLEEESFPLRWHAAASVLVDQVQAENKIDKASSSYFLAPVNYDALPVPEELKSRFGFFEVGEMFDGREFEKHSSCEGMDEAEGMRVMCLRKFTQERDYKAMIEKMASVSTPFAPNGFRPATERDLLHFSQVDPHMSQSMATIAPGATVVNQGQKFLAMVNGEPGWRGMRTRSVDYSFNSKFEVLFVAI